jgi:hypothetical protein
MTATTNSRANLSRNAAAFADACYNDTSLAELHAALTETPDETDCRVWQITPNEWRLAIFVALSERLADLEA